MASAKAKTPPPTRPPKPAPASVTHRRAHGLAAAAALYDVSPQFLRLRIRDGSLRARKVSRRVLIMDDDLVRFFEGDGGKAA
jgi:hypothetical protein